MDSPKINNEEITRVAHELSKLEPGFLPLPIFLEVSRLTVTPILELVPLAIIDNKVNILMYKRSSNDPVWPDMLHTPGTVIRASDKKGSFEDPINRIVHEEMIGIKLLSKPIFYKHYFHMTKRGMQLALAYWVEVDGNFNSDMFYDAHELPKNTVDTQLKFINDALKAFEIGKSIK